MVSEKSSYDLFEASGKTFSAVFDAGLSRGADFCDLFYHYRVRTSLEIRDGIVCDASHLALRGAGVRVVSGVRAGYSHTADLGRQALVSAAASASRIADGPVRAAPAASYPHSRFGQPYGEPAVDYFPSDAKDRLERLDGRMRSLDRRVAKVRLFMVSGYDAILVVNSAGSAAFDLRPMTGFWADCTAESGGVRENNYAGFGGRRPIGDLTAEIEERVAREAVERTVELFDAVPAPAGEFELVLGAGGSGILLHEAIGHGFEADFIRRGHSIFTDRMGTRVASDEVTIVDSGTIPGANGSIAVDDEGTAGQETVLVERGIVRSWMHDLISARSFGVAPTGNGRREDYRHPPQARMRNTYMLPGTRKKEELIASVKRGVYADRFTNGEVNIGPGEFTFYVKSGRMIEDGRLGRPIKDVNIIGNGPRVLGDIVMVADDLEIPDELGSCGKGGQTVAVGMGMPSVKVARITVGGSE